MPAPRSSTLVSLALIAPPLAACSATSATSQARHTLPIVAPQSPPRDTAT